jgi:predicted component of type VI protein secretion system
LLARVEAACAEAVERVFARAFPSALEPVQIARKLVASFESGATAGGRAGKRFRVRVNPSDDARFAPDRTYLEHQWAAMLARLAERSGRPQRPPDVRLEADRTVAVGTVAIAVEALAEPQRLALVVRRGMPAGACFALDRDLVIGRDPACDVVLPDPRVSRRHAFVAWDGASATARDAGSSNGMWINGARVEVAPLQLGDAIVIGDTELRVEDGATA